MKIQEKSRAKKKETTGRKTVLLKTKWWKILFRIEGCPSPLIKEIQKELKTPIKYLYSSPIQGKFYDYYDILYKESDRKHILKWLLPYATSIEILKPLGANYEFTKLSLLNLLKKMTPKNIYSLNDHLNKKNSKNSLKWKKVS